MKRLFVVSLLIFFVSACGSAKALRSVREDLRNAVKEYNDLLRENQFEKAKMFTEESAREKFEASVRAAKDVKVADYRILRTDFETLKGEEIVKVEFDYYISTSAALRTVLDEQRWSFLYVKSEKRKMWRLMTPLPEFK